MNDLDFMRYNRQILLKDIDVDGQKKLLDSHVLIIGLGGLGSPAAFYLTGAGVGTLVLVDYDKVHLSNLQRQILFSTDDIAQFKSKVAKRKLHSLNPNVQLISMQEKLTSKVLYQQVKNADVVLDCTDNLMTRQEINVACVMMNTPMITASAIGFNGQIMILTPPWKYGCYRCLWPDDKEPKRNCYTEGIIGPVVGIMGTLQALEAIKLLCDIDSKRNQIMLFDACTNKWSYLTLQRVHNCTVCGGAYADHI